MFILKIWFCWCCYLCCRSLKKKNPSKFDVALSNLFSVSPRKVEFLTRCVDPHRHTCVWHHHLGECHWCYVEYLACCNPVLFFLFLGCYCFRRAKLQSLLLSLIQKWKLSQNAIDLFYVPHSSIISILFLFFLLMNSFTFLDIIFILYCISWRGKQPYYKLNKNGWLSFMKLRWIDELHFL